MTGNRVIVVGAGGHAAVVADAVARSGDVVVAYSDTDPAKIDTTIVGISVTDERCLTTSFDPDDHILANGIGGVHDTALRRRIQERLEAEGWRFSTVIHPSATIASTASIDPGAQILAGSIVQPGARIGRGAIINSGAIVEHHCVIGAWCHIAPAATICGDAVIGEGSIVGAGAVVIQGIRIGAETLVGAGAVVVASFGGGGTLIGVPAHPRETVA